ncbi:enoyl-CoA hydratase/isomerase family protein [Roseomonas marmotae]|uniref:3-hydroxyisobutyryl-CoA hydrolase n=1 Tax=Roseomonas marmotae TaxID=2768161 RepID=A0ABS3KCC3_9PROT|nr:enoyl-CoA hydratase/isomerase family protein [Roseomonas marmotae]MBO1075090.1 enoyl-CoA hydratase/isomerase family protein [Roseomonas marmotae]QTI79793.1 enoyl-CoA hydratase/isomerase family protein [Roseomonas marmotae]
MDVAESLIMERVGGVAHLRLNRVRALNALDMAMITGIARALAGWREDPTIRMVLVEGEGGRAFCAGGDVRMARQMLLDGNPEGLVRFLAEEYAMNGAIGALRKPWISLIDGICMGGGIGVSVHGSHRIVTEAAVMAMPETTIGLFPDIGASYVLSRMPGALGLWLGLTGARMQGTEAVECGFATHFVPRESLARLREALLAGELDAIGRFARPVPPGRVAELQPVVDRCFGAGSVPAIVAALEAEDTDWAREQLAVLRRVSPTSLFVTHEMLRRARHMDLPGCLAMDVTLARSVTPYPDFAEGVRALLVDKDNNPRWTPASIEEADPARIEAMFG